MRSLTLFVQELVRVSGGNVSAGNILPPLGLKWVADLQVLERRRRERDEPTGESDDGEGV